MAKEENVEIKSAEFSPAEEPKKSKEEPAAGVFAKDSVVINDEQDANRVFNKGWFGAIIEKKLILSLVEALFLMEKGDITVADSKGKPLSFNNFTKKAEKTDHRFRTRYFVYSDIRKRGYITKTALKYGADFRVYERGSKPGETHAKWVLYAVSESEAFSWRGFAAMMRVAHSVRKTLLIGVVDDEGDVTYYTVNWIRP
jgi:tRNA-intron endonuclease